MATSGDLGSLDQIVYIVDSNSAIERAVPGDGRAIKEKGAKRTFRLELFECLPINVNRIGLRRQGLCHGLGQNELQPIKCGESVGCGRVFDHLTNSRSSEAHQPRVVREIFFQDRAAVDDPHRTDKNERAFRRNPKGVASQLKGRIVTGESGFETREYRTEVLTLPDMARSTRLRNPRWAACQSPRGPRIRKAQDRTICHLYRIDPADRSGRSWPLPDP